MPTTATWTGILNPEPKLQLWRGWEQSREGYGWHSGLPALLGDFTSLHQMYFLDLQSSRRLPGENTKDIHRKGGRSCRFSSQNQKRMKVLHREWSKSDFPATLSMPHPLFSSMTKEMMITF